MHKEGDVQKGLRADMHRPNNETKERVEKKKKKKNVFSFVISFLVHM